METYIISFKKGDTGLAANDAFQAICSEMPEGSVGEDGVYTIGDTTVQNTYDTLIITGKESTARYIAGLISKYYREYEPIITNGTDFEESAKPRIGNLKESFSALRKGKYNKMVIDEALAVLKAAGAVISEDTDTLEHEIEDEYADANGKPGWDKVHASSRTERLKKQAYDSSLAAKIAAAKKFNGDTATEETDEPVQNTIAGVCSVLNSMGIDVNKKYDIDLYEDDNNAYIKPDLGFCKFGNNKSFIDTLIEFTDLKKGKIRMYMSIRKSNGLGTERVNCGVPDFKANIKNVSEIKPAILKFVQTCLDKGMNVDKDSYTNRIGKMNKWEKLVKKYNLA